MDILDAFRMLNEDLYRFYSHCSKIELDAQNVGDKDFYFNRTNAFGIHLLNQTKYHDAEIFYEQCLNKIYDFENKFGITLAKGMPLGNLGVAQVALGKTDDGICNLISAKQDDLRYSSSKLSLNNDMYLQFERRLVEDVLHLFKITDSDYYRKYIEKLDKNIEYRLFQFLILKRLFSSYCQLKLNKHNPNARGIIFTTFRDQSLLLEQILRDCSVSGKFYSEILKNSKLISDSNNCSQENDIEFNKNLDLHLKTTNGVEKYFKLSLCIRNFNNHRFTINCSTFFDNIEDLFNFCIIQCPISLIKSKIV